VRILLAGGTGFIGRYMAWSLAQRGHQSLVLTRRPLPSCGGVRHLLWDGVHVSEDWLSVARDCSAWVNLCGESVAEGRWTAARKKLLTESRLGSTRTLVQAMEKIGVQPRVFINASAAGFYGDTGDRRVDESLPSGKGFLAELCAAWESEALKASRLGVRTVCLRLGAVLGRGGGMLARLIPVFRLFLGGHLGSGTQWLPWISREDLAGLIAHLLCADLSGGVNATAPNPVSNRDFGKALGRVLGRPSRLWTPGFMLRLAWGEMAGMLLSGQRALPKKALASGFVFKQPDIYSALRAELL